MLLSSLESYVAIVAYLALFFGVGLLFIFFNLFIGRFVRGHDPHPEKQEIYECGEPTIGSSYVQFDLRFYVVALLFIIFDVEIAFFFPWAAVFGKANHLANQNLPVVTGRDDNLTLTPSASGLYQELGVLKPELPGAEPASLRGQISAAGTRDRQTQIIKAGSRQLAAISVFDIAVFFAVLMVGFFYVWKRGDLDWVRAVSRDRDESSQRGPPRNVTAEEPVLSA